MFRENHLVRRMLSPVLSFARARLARLTLVAALSLMAVAASAGSPSVTNVRASQRTDLSGLVGFAIVTWYISE